MKPLPIRLKFALWASALTGIALAAYSIGTFINLYHEQIEGVDLELEGEARHLLELDAESLDHRSAEEILRYRPWLTLVHFDENGKITLHSQHLPEAIARAALTIPGLHTARSGETRWRLAAWPRAREVFVLAYDLDEAREVVRDLVVGYTFSLPVVLLIAGFGGWWVSGRALRPVIELTAAAEKVQAAELHQRVPVPKANDEIQRLAVVFNAMLSRLEGSFTQAQRFAADASHELRTPLTIMKAEVERLLHANGLSNAQESTLVSLQEEISRLDRITEHLLLLARFDTGRAELRLASIDFSALVSEVCEDSELLGTVHHVQIVQRVPAKIMLKADAVHLRRLLLNLFNNAIHYNHPGGEVVCTVVEREVEVGISIANTGPGIPLEQRTRLFQRFFRVDPSRTQRAGHGLGLSLCREIVQAHGGTIALDPQSREGWTRFVISLSKLG